MTFSINKYSALWISGALICFGLVQTQTAEGSALPGDVGFGQAADGDTADIATDNRSADEILMGARKDLDKMQAASDNVGRQLRQAREQKDVLKTLCLDDVLNQMNVATRSIADRVKSMEDAFKANNLKRVKQDDSVLGALTQRGSELIAEANQCVGEETGVLGQTDLQIQVDPSIPTQDVSTPPAPVVISAPPVAASPTL